MAFVKTTWVDSSVPDITAAQLNRMEQGIADAHGGLNVPLVPALPGGATDGLQVLLEADKAGAYGGPYLWRCRYSSKWADGSARTPGWDVLDASPLRVEGVGGRAWGPASDANHAVTSLSAAPLPGGPAITVPFAGVYEMEGSAMSMATSTASAPCLFGWVTGDGAPAWQTADSLAYAGVVNQAIQLWFKRTRAMNAGDSAEVRYCGSGAANAVVFQDRNLYLKPVRLTA